MAKLQRKWQTTKILGQRRSIEGPVDTSPSEKQHFNRWRGRRYTNTKHLNIKARWSVCVWYEHLEYWRLYDSQCVRGQMWVKESFILTHSNYFWCHPRMRCISTHFYPKNIFQVHLSWSSWSPCMDKNGV